MPPMFKRPPKRRNRSEANERRIKRRYEKRHPEEQKVQVEEKKKGLFCVCFFACLTPILLFLKQNFLLLLFLQL